MKFYDEEEFKDLKSLLGNLPRVKTEDNFEFNLLTKIENHNYSEPRKKFSWWMYSAPAAVLGLFVLALFMVLGGYNQRNINMPATGKTPILLTNDGSGSQPAVSHVAAAAPAKAAPLAKTEPRAQQKTGYPFNEARSLDLDSYLRNNVPMREGNGRAHLVNESDPSIPGVESSNAVRSGADSVKRAEKTEEN